ncbi:phytanoyl-CoA dioxygenase family protein [Streptomyces muensis]|uniref:Phytanoyl-CoA dioxygenase family protein n=1 Tax=Streptomyces muensis TaxID=1077944 RepID=A0A9X1Q3U3_STRM4|nr:phytanoyl-CoA dioxygenase family protein [Streptomyces muensis]MCF1598462.1 phytanoyl-CoA dioxygenase family protein [Streptomyces muensis]
MSNTPTHAPTGFTHETWETFRRDGFLVIEDALDKDQVAALVAAVNKQEKPRDWNIVAVDSHFTEMIDSPSHIGYAYDVYGEMLKLLRSEYFRREPGQEIRNKWHFDGPRSTPFEVFSPRAPLRIKVGYWLTPLGHEDMGNLVYIPGSHRWPHLPQYHTHESHPQERQIIVPPGAMTLMWSGLWHRVAPNRSEFTRLNLFFEYGPSWIVSSDRGRSDPDWLSGLSRARRILMRDYDEPNDWIRLPAEDVPLYTLRPGESDLEAGQYGDHVPPQLRKRSTWLERNGML